MKTKFPALHPTEIPVVKGSEPPSWLGDRWVISAVFKPGRGDSSCGCHSSCDRASKCWTSGFCQGLRKMWKATPNSCMHGFIFMRRILQKSHRTWLVNHTYPVVSCSSSLPEESTASTAAGRLPRRKSTWIATWEMETLKFSFFGGCGHSLKLD